MDIEFTELHKNDREAVFDLLQNDEVMRFIGPRRPLTADEAEVWFQDALDHPSRFVFRSVESGELLGFCGVKQINGVWDFGYYLRRRFWGKGIGKAMCRLAVDRLQREYDLDDVEVFIADGNSSSLGVAASLGWS